MITPDFSQFPELHTPRLLLRKVLETDIPDLFEFRSDPEVMKYIPRPIAKTEADVLPLLKMINDFLDQNERINWAIEWKETNKVVGMMGFVNIEPQHSRAEVGYSMNRSWYRKGITREALTAIIDYGFQKLELHSVEAIIDAENAPSGGVLENFGFRKEAYFKENFFHNGNYRNSIHYGLLHNEPRPSFIS